MSMLGYTGLNQAVNEYGLIKPSDVLSHVHQYLKNMLQKTTLNRPVFDGMDITLCKLDLNNNIIECCGANNPIYMVRNGEFFKITGDRVTIGDVMIENLQLTNQEIQMKSGDIIYMVTDGFSDQFGGDAGKKFSSRRFIDLLKSICSKPCTMQLSILEKTFEEWMKGQEQVDDVTVCGILI